MERLLEIMSLESGYGRISILKAISISIVEGEIFSIVGSNGAGKSTLLKTISGLLKPMKGQIYFSGLRISDLPAHRIVEKGLIQVPESRRLFPYMSVLKNLEIGSFNNNARKNKDELMENIFDLFPVLKDRRHVIAKSLSGGEQQMLAIGRGMMANPKLLMLDEPSLGLAPIFVGHIYDMIQRINKTNVTIVLVEEKVDVSLNVSTSAIVLENGKIVLSGPGGELLKNEYLQRAYLGM